MKNPQKLQRNIRLYYLAEFFGALSFITPVWVNFQHRFLSFTQMSTVASVATLILVLLQLPTGAFADVVGRKKSTAIGYLITTIGMLIIASADSGAKIFAGAILNAIGEAFYSGANVALIYDSLRELGREKEFAKIRGQAVVFVQIALIISSVLAGYLYQFSIGLPYVSFGLATLIASGLYLLTTEPQIEADKFTIRSYFTTLKLGIRETFKNSYVRNLSLFYIVVGGLTWSWQVYFNQIYATSIGFTVLEKSWLFGIIRFVNVILLIKILHLERLLSGRHFFVIFPVLMIFSSLPAIIPSQAVGTLLLFVLTLSSTLRFVVLDPFVNREFAPKYRATALSMLILAVFSFYSLIVLVIGPLIDRFGVSLIYLLSSILTVVIVFPAGIKLAKHKDIPIIL